MKEWRKNAKGSLWNKLCIWLAGFGMQEFLGSEPKFAEPTARPEGAVRCTAAKLVSDPNNSGSATQAIRNNAGHPKLASQMCKLFLNEP